MPRQGLPPSLLVVFFLFFFFAILRHNKQRLLLVSDEDSACCKTSNFTSIHAPLFSCLKQRTVQRRLTAVEVFFFLSARRGLLFGFFFLCCVVCALLCKFTPFSSAPNDINSWLTDRGYYCRWCVFLAFISCVHLSLGLWSLASPHEPRHRVNQPPEPICIAARMHIPKCEMKSLRTSLCCLLT